MEGEEEDGRREEEDVRREVGFSLWPSQNLSKNPTKFQQGQPPLPKSSLEMCSQSSDLPSYLFVCVLKQPHRGGIYRITRGEIICNGQLIPHELPQL